MLNGLYSAAAGMIAQQTRIDALSNDISNVNTTGYKQVRTGFKDLVYNIEAGMRVGAGAAVVDAGRLFGQGGLQQTGEPLSLALDGPGFFQVKRGDGSVALTRSGDFHADAKGQLVTAEGDRVWPPVALPAGTNVDDVSISAAGLVTVKQAVVGKIQVVSVPSPSNLLPVGGSLFLPTAQSGPIRPMATQGIRQGFLESSNVDLASAMVNVIDAQRSFQMDSRAIQTQDQLMQIANEIRR
jgi:flagellar basal-body rod protein FlgG